MEPNTIGIEHNPQPHDIFHKIETMRQLCERAESPYLLEQTQRVAWLDLCVMFERVSTEHPEFPMMMSAALELTAEWPSRVCVAPTRWLDKLARGGAEPRCQLAKSVDVRGLKLDGRGLMRVLTSQYMSRCAVLRLDDQDLGLDVVRALADSPYLRALRELYCSRTGLGDDGLELLVESANLRCVEILSACNANISDDGIFAIAQSVELVALRELYLGENTIGDRGAIALTQVRRMWGLERLGLGNNPEIGHEGAGYLARRAPQRFPKMRSIDLWGCDVTDDLCWEVSVTNYA